MGTNVDITASMGHYHYARLFCIRLLHRCQSVANLHEIYSRVQHQRGEFLQKLTNVLSESEVCVFGFQNGLLSSLPYFGKYFMAVLASYLADHLRRTGKLSTTAARKIFTTFGMVYGSVVVALCMLIFISKL
jgi:hypothetical protein